jgi:DNA-binding NarL/FixJ family response regulator
MITDSMSGPMSAISTTTVAIGRFHDLQARGLRGLIDDDPALELVAEDVSSLQLSATLRSTHAQVAIVDVGSLLSPVEVRELASRHPSANLILLADNPSSVECAQLLAFGAAACLAKSTQARDILNAIHLASRGLQLTPREQREGSLGPSLLTQRETDVLAHLQQRHSNAQIAAELHISIETVRTHARHIYRKLGVTSRRELLAPSAQPAPGLRV